MNRSNLDTLRKIPVPVEKLSKKESAAWNELHTQLASASIACFTSDRVSRPLVARSSKTQRLLFHQDDQSTVLADLTRKLNGFVNTLLGLSEIERILVEDFVGCRQFAVQGKVVPETADEPTCDELNAYASVLAQELDAFFEDDPNYRHRVAVTFAPKSRSGIVEIESQRNSARPIRPEVITADPELVDSVKAARRRIHRERPQWLYFERNLRFYEGHRTFLIKPLQRIHWLRSQALLDADSIIREILVQGP